MTSDSVEDLFERYGPGYRRFAVVTGMVAAFTMVLSGTVVNVAVPHVMGAFGVGQDQAQFLSTAYIATMTASQLLNAWFVARFGQRLTFVIVLINFVAGGLICATSPSLDLIIAGRVMQGFSAGIVQPLVLVTIVQVFPLERRGMAAGIYLSGLTLAIGFGPVVGGLTVDALGWRYIFLMPLPLVLAALAMGTFFMPSAPSDEPPAPFDWTGYLLLCTAIYCLMSGLGGGQRLGWDSDRILAYWLIGGAATLAFVRSQMGERATLLDFGLLANPPFAAAIVLSVVYGMGNFSMTYSIPVFAQLVQGMTPSAAGLLLLPAGLLVVFVTPITGRLSDHYSPIAMIVTGLLIFAGGAFALGTGDVNTPFFHIAAFVVICRFGMAWITPVLTATALKSLPPGGLNKGSGTINFFRQLGGAFGINATVAILERRSEFHSDAITATQGADNAATRDLLDRTTELLASSGLPERVQELVALDHLASILSAQAMTRAYQDGFTVIGAVFMVALFPAWILGRARASGR